MKTYHIHINGIVQGIGFRPFISRLAHAMQLNGTVSNDGDGVHIYITSNEATAKAFYKKTIADAPKQALIQSHTCTEVALQMFPHFSIIEAPSGDKKQTSVTPDMATCPQCIAELHDPNNRRYRYPFISCTQCGPRYSIVTALPYERYHTTMHEFDMCEDCLNEYNHAANRRFFSQTNSCDTCGIQLSLFEKNVHQAKQDTASILSYCKSQLALGKILAVKGTGGYLLLCDANNATAIQTLRARKGRPHKPLAVLYPNIEQVITDFAPTTVAIDWLTSTAAPIVILKPHTQPLRTAADIAPGLQTMGVMLPSNPLLHLLVCDFGKPLIATSGNLSGSAIIYKNEDTWQHLATIADSIISHNMHIVSPQDDSVVKQIPNSDAMVFIRRSRGYAPVMPGIDSHHSSTILAMGATMKSAFSLQIHQQIFVSQYLGSSASYEAQEMYRQALWHFKTLYHAKPEVILADNHPDYFTHQLAKELAATWNADCRLIQHHQAHFSAILTEHHLWHSNEKILGVIWDGSGLGNDGQIWGSEFLSYSNNEMNRLFHLAYTPMIANDKMATEPFLSALSYCSTLNEWPAFIENKFSHQALRVYKQLITTNTIKTSSMGRLFDALASMLSLCDTQTYEGMAATLLQAEAESYFDQYGFEMIPAYNIPVICDDAIVHAPLIAEIIADIQRQKSAAYIAAKFHYTLVRLIEKIATDNGFSKLCFSGGVFQNTLLIQLIRQQMGLNFELYFHQNIAPNDENIALGQLMYFNNNCNNIQAGIAMNYKKENQTYDTISITDAIL